MSVQHDDIRAFRVRAPEDALVHRASPPTNPPTFRGRVAFWPRAWPRGSRATLLGIALPGFTWWATYQLPFWLKYAYFLDLAQYGSSFRRYATLHLSTGTAAAIPQSTLAVTLCCQSPTRCHDCGVSGLYATVGAKGNAARHGRETSMATVDAFEDSGRSEA